MKIRRRKSKKRYLEKKGVYDYEQLYVDIPAKFREVVEPFLNKNLDMDVQRDSNDRVVIVLAPRENVSGARKTPAKIPCPKDTAP